MSQPGKEEEGMTASSSRGAVEFGPAQFECAAATLAWSLFRDRPIVDRALLYSVLRAATGFVQLEDKRLAWIGSAPFSELAARARLEEPVAREALLKLVGDGIVLAEEERTLVLAPSDLAERSLDQDLGLRMAYAWCFETPLDPEERAVIGTILWKEACPEVMVRAGEWLGLPEARVEALLYGVHDHFDRLTAETEGAVGGVPSATPEARICRAVIATLGRERVRPEWIDVDAPAGWTSAECVSGAVAYRSTTERGLVVVGFEATDAKKVRWREILLFFPAELTGDMLLNAGTAFLRRGARAKIGTGLFELEREAGMNCFRLRTSVPFGSLKLGDVTLTKEGIDRLERWMKQEFARRRAGTIPS